MPDSNDNSSIPQAWNYILAAIKAGKITRDEVLRRAQRLGQDEGQSQSIDLSPEGIAAAFPSMCDTPKTPLGKEIVKDIMRMGLIHVWSGLFESYKTMFGCEVSSKILNGGKVAQFFEVCPGWEEEEKKKFLAEVEVLWVNLDMPHELLREYAEPFGLSASKRFRWNAPKTGDLFGADDPRLQLAVKGRIVFFDTMLDIARIKEAFQSAEWVSFFQKVRKLINEHGMVAAVLIAHPTKSSQKGSDIDPADYLKDSVTLGGKIDAGFAFRKVPKTDTVHIERIKGRGWKQQGFSFSVAVIDEEGNSNLDRGEFPVCVFPEEKKPFSSKAEKGRPGPKSKKSEYADKIREELRKEGWPLKQDIGVSVQDLMKRVDPEGKGELNFETFKTWVRDIKQELF